MRAAGNERNVVQPGRLVTANAVATTAGAVATAIGVGAGLATRFLAGSGDTAAAGIIVVASLGYLLALSGAYPRVPTMLIALATVGALVLAFDLVLLLIHARYLDEIGCCHWSSPFRASDFRPLSP